MASHSGLHLKNGTVATPWTGDSAGTLLMGCLRIYVVIPFTRCKRLICDFAWVTIGAMTTEC